MSESEILALLTELRHINASLTRINAKLDILTGMSEVS